METFDVLVGVFVYDEDKSGFELTDAEITVYADGDSLTIQALFAATSKLTFPDRFEEFRLIVSKEGYTSFDYTYSADSIKNYQGDNANSPLEIILASLDVSEGLIAYYTFNGNANDESGNGLNGEVQGATLTEDRNGNSNSAYSFDGVDDYINTYLSFDNQEQTISLWFFTSGLVSNEFTNVIAVQDSDELQYGRMAIGWSVDSLIATMGGPMEKITQPVKLNNWYHVVLTRNATDVKMYS